MMSCILSMGCYLHIYGLSLSIISCLVTNKPIDYQHHHPSNLYLYSTFNNNRVSIQHWNTIIIVYSIIIIVIIIILNKNRSFTKAITVVVFFEETTVKEQLVPKVYGMTATMLYTSVEDPEEGFTCRLNRFVSLGCVFWEVQRRTL